MSSLGFQSCFNHPVREAVARCPACTRVYCRECITDHEERIICAGCLQKLVKESTPAKRPVSVPWRIVTVPLSLLIGVSIAWLSFYSIGRVLLAIPSEFHSGAVWASQGELGETE